MDLDEYDDDAVLDALVQIAKDPKENSIILYSCGESIGQIWVRRNIFDKEIYNTLSQPALQELQAIIEHNKPELIKQLNKES